MNIRPAGSEDPGGVVFFSTVFSAYTLIQGLCREWHLRGLSVGYQMMKLRSIFSDWCLSGWYLYGIIFS